MNLSNRDVVKVGAFTLIETTVALMISAIIITLAWEGLSNLKGTIVQLWETRTAVLAQQETRNRIAADVAIGVVQPSEGNQTLLSIAATGNNSIVFYQNKTGERDGNSLLLRSGLKNSLENKAHAAAIPMQMPFDIVHQPFGKTKIWTTIPSEKSPFELEFQGFTPAAAHWRKDLIDLKIDSYAPEN